MNDKLKVKRLPERGHYDKETIYNILDASYICQVGFVHNDCPVVIPTIYVRVGDHIFLHGAVASRMLKELKKGIPMSVCITLVDGIVLARSGFNSSLNYRSVVVFGQAAAVKDLKEKEKVFDAIVESIAPGRRAEIRAHEPGEIKGTQLLKLSLDQASAKIRTGNVSDKEADYDLPIWAGVVPIEKKFGTPVPDPKLKFKLQVPDSVKKLIDL